MQKCSPHEHGSGFQAGGVRARKASSEPAAAAGAGTSRHHRPPPAPERGDIFKRLSFSMALTLDGFTKRADAGFVLNAIGHADAEPPGSHRKVTNSSGTSRT